MGTLGCKFLLELFSDSKRYYEGLSIYDMSHTRRSAGLRAESLIS